MNLFRKIILQIMHEVGDLLSFSVGQYTFRTMSLTWNGMGLVGSSTGVDLGATGFVSEMLHSRRNRAAARAKQCMKRRVLKDGLGGSGKLSCSFQGGKCGGCVG